MEDVEDQTNAIESRYRPGEYWKQVENGPIKKIIKVEAESDEPTLFILEDDEGKTEELTYLELRCWYGHFSIVHGRTVDDSNFPSKPRKDTKEDAEPAVDYETFKTPDPEPLTPGALYQKFPNAVSLILTREGAHVSIYEIGDLDWSGASYGESYLEPRYRIYELPEWLHELPGVFKNVEIAQPEQPEPFNHHGLNFQVDFGHRLRAMRVWAGDESLAYMDAVEARRLANYILDEVLPHIDEQAGE